MLAEGCWAGLLVQCSVASHAWGSPVGDHAVETCFVGHDEEAADFENYAAECFGSSAVESFEGGVEEEYCEMSYCSAAADFGCSVGVHFV